MPAYDYLCTACNVRTEFIHGIHGLGPVRCPNCGSEGTMRKSFAAPAVHFKGSGWAKRDRRPARKSDKGTGEGGSEGGEQAAASKTDGSASSKPAASGGSKRIRGVDRVRRVDWVGFVDRVRIVNGLTNGQLGSRLDHARRGLGDSRELEHPLQAIDDRHVGPYRQASEHQARWSTFRPSR